jgi:hypothetical protein
MVARTITLRLSDTAYEAVRRHAEADNRSMNAWIEEVIDAEDMRRRCAAHCDFLANNPHVVGFAEDWAERNLSDLTQR